MFNRRSKVVSLAALALLLAAPSLAAAGDDRAACVDADNTGRNADGGSGLTAMDQSSDPGDIAVTREIRQRITNQESLSMNARNVKVITIDRVVTLRGPVDNAAEKLAVANIARNVAGVKSVDDQLEIDAQ